jgi:hypothetical protein
VPKERIHLNKKISRAESNDDGVVLHFEDGTSAYGDILIGADGIRSVGYCVHSVFNFIDANSNTSKSEPLSSPTISYGLAGKYL